VGSQEGFQLIPNNPKYAVIVESNKHETQRLLIQLATAIEQLFAPYCEVVIHDFSDMEHSIIHVEGALSGRNVGGGATDLLLSRVRAGETQEDLHNYKTTLPGDRRIKSSTIFLRDGNGKAYGAFCINYDTTPLVAFQRVLTNLTSLESQGAVSETLSDDVTQTIQGIIAETVRELGISAPMLSRDAKIRLMARLDEKGVFQVKKAAAIVADQFGFSRATVYNYLREGRERRDTVGDDVGSNIEPSPTSINSDAA
jgi:predicted transcriptional regulator YheO